MHHRLLMCFMAAVWLANVGLFGMVLRLVPRHERIVARILSSEYAGLLTRAIGAAEIVMAVWIVSGFLPRLNAVTQIAVVAAMNILEFFLASDLLLWGHFNALYAAMFIVVIYYSEFVLRPKVHG